VTCASLEGFFYGCLWLVVVGGGGLWLVVLKIGGEGG